MVETHQVRATTGQGYPFGQELARSFAEDIPPPADRPFTAFLGPLGRKVPRRCSISLRYTNQVTYVSIAQGLFDLAPHPKWISPFRRPSDHAKEGSP